MSDLRPANAVDTLLSTLTIPADMQQREAIRTVLQLPHDWHPAEQAAVVASILARSPQQQERLKGELTQFLKPAVVLQPQAAGDPLEMATTPDAIARPKEAGATSVAGAIRDAVRAAPKRNFWGAGGFLVVSAALALVTFAGNSPSGPVEVARNGLSGGRDILTWILGGLVIAVPLGWVIDVTLSAGHKWRKRLVRPTVRARNVLAQGAAWFSAESVASAASTRLFTGQQTLSMGRAAPFRTGGLDSPKLDPARSVRATVSSAVPTLRFVPRLEPWPVLVLNDLDSSARGWSEAPKAIRNALANAGLEAGYGVFYGTPERFELEDGGRLDLDTLLRNDTLLLLVSDGAMLGETAKARHALERLGATRRAAWLDEREVRFWHASDAHFGVPGVSVWPATADGVVGALRELGGERVTAPRPNRLALRAPSGTSPSAQLARGLGDAIAWAASCAMIQPIGPGLAELLRANFFPGLQPIAFGRLVALPGSRLTQSGLRFGLGLLDPLRQEFAAGIAPPRRALILQCIRREIEGKCPLRNGPAHDAWSWYRARFLIDQSFGEAVPELLRLQGSALAAAIQQDLHRIRLPDAPPSSDPKVVVRLLRNPDHHEVRSLLQLSLAYQISPAGGPLKLWRIVPGRPESMALAAIGQAVAVSAAAPADAFIAALLENGSVQVQGAPRPKAAPKLSSTRAPEAHSNTSVPLFALSHDARFAADANGDVTGIRVRDRLSGDRDPLSEVLARSDRSSLTQGPVSALAWSPAAPVLVYASSQNGLALVDFHGDEAAFEWSDLDRLYTAVGFSSDGAALALVQRSGQTAVRSAPAFSSRDQEQVIDLRIDDADAVALDGTIMAVAGDGRLVVIKRSGARVGTWKLPPGRVDGIALVDQEAGQEPSVAVLIREELLVIHAATGVEMLIADAQGVRGRKHAAIGIERQLALLWSDDKRRIDMHVMDRDDGAIPSTAP